MFALAIAFFTAFIGTKNASATGINMIYVIATYLFITIGELLISPVGLAMITMLVPQELVGLMMGFWFIALGVGEKLAGIIANFAAIPKQINTFQAINQIYGHAFFLYANLALICGIACLIVTPVINKLIDLNLNARPNETSF
jgi:POT family proton-dependent oligopeptide transporter